MKTYRHTQTEQSPMGLMDVAIDDTELAARADAGQYIPRTQPVKQVSSTT